MRKKVSWEGFSNMSGIVLDLFFISIAFLKIYNNWTCPNDSLWVFPILIVYVFLVSFLGDHLICNIGDYIKTHKNKINFTIKGNDNE